jgi:hypothetical protein
MKTMTNINPTSATSSNDDALRLLAHQFNDGEAKNCKRDYFVDCLASFILRHPEHTQEAYKYASKKLDARADQLQKLVQAHESLKDARLLSRSVIEGMNSLGGFDYSIAELVCGSVAAHIDASCKRNNGDPLPHLLSLMTVAGALLGGNVRVYSGIEDGDLPLSLRFLNVADTSDGKSKTTKKVVDPLRAVERAEKLRIEAALAEIDKVKTTKDEKGNEQAVTAEDRKKLKRVVETNQRSVLMDSKSFSAEALVKRLVNQESKAGLMLYRDEASDLLQHERYGAKGGGSTNQTSGLFKATVMTSQTDCLYGSVDRVNSENGGDFDGQTISVLGNIQLKFLPDIVDFSEDSHGWGSRWLFCRANRQGLPEVVRTLRSADPLNKFVTERLIPFLLGVKPVTATEVNTSGLPLDYIRLGFSPKAQLVYNAFVNEVRQRIEGQRDVDACESAYLAWLAKASIRVPTIAAILHCLELLEGTHGSVSRTLEADIQPDETNDHLVVRTFNSNQAFRPNRSEQKTFEDIFGDGWLTISEENTRRAIRIEQLLGDEFLIIGDSASVAVRTRQAAHVNNELRTDLRFILKKLKERGDITQTAFRSSLRGGRLKLNSEDLQGRIDELVAKGCIKRWVDGKTFITYEKPLRG